MNKSKKQLIVLAVLLILLSVSIYSQMNNSTPPAKVTSLPARSHSKPPFRHQPEVLDVQILESSAPDLSGVKRNIFQFGSQMIAQEKPTPVLHTPQSQP